MTEHIDLFVRGDTAEEAIAAAKAWVHAEPRLRLRTVAKVVKRQTPEGTWAGAWTVTLAVSVL